MINSARLFLHLAIAVPLATGVEFARGCVLHPVYLRLVVLTAGTLLPLFWIVVILGHRRQRNFERVFFFLCLALVFFFGASLLALNAQLYYGAVPAGLERFSWMVLCVGLWMVPALLLHLHLEYAKVRELVAAGAGWAWLTAAYLPAALLAPKLYSAAGLRTDLDFLAPTNRLGLPFRVWLVGAVLLSVWWQWRFLNTAPDRQQKRFHRTMVLSLALIAVWIVAAHTVGHVSESVAAWYTMAVAVFALVPLVALIRDVQQFNFLQIGRQRNLIYAVFVTFVALLYLSLVRRISLWLEPLLPPEASAAILLFLPLVFFEPLQRLVGRVLHRTAQSEMEMTQRMIGPIQEMARLGNVAKLREFSEGWIREQLQLAEVRLNLEDKERPSDEAVQGTPERFVIRQGNRRIGTLQIKSHGAMLSGETHAALEFLCEQLPPVIDLCRLIEEKLRLERELAERERLALVGQTAASISHNLKNPLGSIKTILQVQLESPELPESMRAETRMILEEVGRLSAKLNQLLQFSRPAVRGGSRTASCDVRAVVEEVSAVLKHEADRRGLALETVTGPEPIEVSVSAEALNDILSNLVVNALEATPKKGHVRIFAAANGATCHLTVEDDGAGIPQTAREKILQPFYTTKAQGTGLGLAIVARRVSESGGKLNWTSPVEAGRGTRFEIVLPLAENKA
jgi:signal transduction histidine kinase